ncbi:hypothetical protein CFP65_7083 [Kitasatospora sp. MMS16-BH015]|uniref:ATP-binding protein n=1 Tax=Kitasatospora sp. MMS16-BH015 TaxID=2018025 RepID=UPI000CA233F1|nr:ATP-binding protein [Kitasatospora sp. MMS16-BH015]AUG81687.1 hypothetical protein CFP65_7083 [Kitasatospora sp. MMS16-BH015]
MDGPVVTRAQNGARSRRLTMTAAYGAVRRCRDFSRGVLADWGWRPGQAEEDVLLMVSELVTNACLYAPGGPRELRLDWDGRRLRVEVADDAATPPRLRGEPDPARPGGHGLRVVEQLADRWGSQPTGDGKGKLVWLEVDHPAGPRPPDQR